MADPALTDGALRSLVAQLDAPRPTSRGVQLTLSPAQARALSCAADLAREVLALRAGLANARGALADVARGDAPFCEDCGGTRLATQWDDHGNPLCDEHASAEAVVVRRDTGHADAIRAALAAAAAPASPTLVRAPGRSARVGARPLDPGPPRAPDAVASVRPRRNT